MKSYKVVLADEARGQLRSIQRWWKSNRPSNPGLFREEFQAAVDLLRRLPTAGAPYEEIRLPGVRRFLLSRTRYYLYYTLDEGSRTVEVVALWHMSRGEGPLP